MTASPKTQRLEARINATQKEMIAQAAALQGLSVSEFVVQAAHRQALEALDRHQTWQLSQRDQAAFVAALMAPPAPGPALLAAAERSRARFE